MNHNKLSDYAGWAGLCAIQASTLPPLASVIFGTGGKLPPLTMVVPIVIGLTLYLYRGIIRHDTVAIVSNGLGFALNFLLLAIIVYG